MNDPQAEAHLFLYDLANLATEHWFKPGEGWALTLANEAQKIAIEKQYHPTLYISGETGFLRQVYELMKPALKQIDSAPEPETRGVRTLPPTFLLAFNPERTRK